MSGRDVKDVVAFVTWWCCEHFSNLWLHAQIEGLQKGLGGEKGRKDALITATLFTENVVKRLKIDLNKQFI